MVLGIPPKTPPRALFLGEQKLDNKPGPDGIVRRNRGKGYWSRVEDRSAFEEGMERILKHEKRKKERQKKEKKS